MSTHVCMSRLHIKFLIIKFQEFKQAFRKQRKFNVAMARKGKTDFCKNLSEREITHNG